MSRSTAKPKKLIRAIAGRANKMPARIQKLNPDWVDRTPRHVLIRRVLVVNFAIVAIVVAGVVGWL